VAPRISVILKSDGLEFASLGLLNEEQRETIPENPIAAPPIIDFCKKDLLSIAIVIYVIYEIIVYIKLIDFY